MVMAALNIGTPNLKDVARAAGISYNAARAYKKGQRTPSPEVRRQLARALRHFATRLQKAAANLEAV